MKERKADELIDALIAKKVPVAKIKDLKAVFEDPKAQSLILTEEIDHIPTKRVKTVIYTISKA